MTRVVPAAPGDEVRLMLLQNWDAGDPRGGWAAVRFVAALVR